ncbi:DUF1654 domain-containing protein [Pseudomonas aeruginosa]|uniref:DUF1654 domain-containing protein n=2 Tax=Pseudomonas aeruginosa TaxID=287 RepID=UPI00032DD3A1|nr:DUF1654 domain-containing protein [Pseudomonas aeruginosa]EOQ79131.1 hypothetical protein K652_18762 [Pseudomonas aeruginosa VRFPA02]KSN19159.1 hypothetical protein APA78_31590 [Pseudomonas aeruginosa]MBF3126107.1 DUF1654 domain-containing protein [Pseudomonas aeruginosa]MBK1796480.1 DUF1654 domain-containing protein [Pseudomonas aeruginosa]MDP5739016.1 DUF1654 domain-containing protein [Pseudomonas aeruginosa]
MARQKKAQQPRQELTAADRLGLRVSAMIGSPKAQLERRAVIHRLDTDTDEAWDAIMELLAETDGLALVFDDEGNVIVTWAAGETEEVAESREVVEQVEEEVPF